jgi:hypothetical protein
MFMDKMETNILILLFWICPFTIKEISHKSILNRLKKIKRNEPCDLYKKKKRKHRNEDKNDEIYYRDPEY